MNGDFALIFTSIDAGSIQSSLNDHRGRLRLQISLLHPAFSPPYTYADHFSFIIDIGYDSDTDSSDSTETIRPSATTPTIHTMSKSKSADQLRSLSISDDIFDTSADEPTTSTALTRQGDRSIDNQTNIITSPQYAPRADRGTEINEYNAQGQLPPEAAIFCAK